LVSAIQSGKTPASIPTSEFSNDTITSYLAIIYSNQKESKDVVELPAIFDPMEWEDFETGNNWISSYSCWKSTSAFILCTPWWWWETWWDSVSITITPSQRFWNSPLTGDIFDEDERCVCGNLSGQINTTDGWDIIKKYSKGEQARTAHKELKSFYDSTSEVNKRMSRARAELENVCYTSKQVFPFIKYVAKLRGLFDTLEKGKQGRSEQEKELFLIEHISTSNQQFASALQSVSALHRSDFRAACKVLSCVVSDPFPLIQAGSKRWSISELETGNIGGEGEIANNNSINGVKFHHGRNWDSNFPKDDYFNFPRMVRQLIGLAKDVKKEKGDPSTNFDPNSKRRGKKQRKASQVKVEEDREEEDDAGCKGTKEKPGMGVRFGNRGKTKGEEWSEMADGPLSVKPDLDVPDWMWFAKWVFEGANLTELHIQNEAPESIHRSSAVASSPIPCLKLKSEGENNDDISAASTVSKTYGTVTARSRSLYAQISKYITGTDILYCSRKDCIGLTQPYNTGYAVKYHFFAQI
jgi:hypothetical protein